MEVRRRLSKSVAVAALAACVASAGLLAAAQAPSAAGQLQVPVEYFKLKNGLKVVLSRDMTTPTAVVAVYYNIGFRNEPKDKTGFSHLFEHMMFQGSQNLGKMEFIRLVESNGGLLNGSTRFDFTNYFQVVPSHVLETILWAEADRMRGLEHRRRQPEEPAGSGQERGQGQRPQPALRRVPVDRPADGGQPELVQRPQLLRRPRAPRRGHARRRAVVLPHVLRAEQRRPGRHRRLRRRFDEGLDRKVLRRHPGDEAAAAGGPARAAAGEGEARRPDRSAGDSSRRSGSPTTCPSG